MAQDLNEEFLKLRSEYIYSRFGRLNDMQKEAVFFGKGPLLILAGAGSGKTTVLVNRVANLVLFGTAAQSEKIYGTPEQRHIDELSDMIANKQTEISSEMRRLLSVDAVRPYNILAITFTNKAAGELKERLEKMLGEDGLDINASTFHSMCVRILRRNAELLGFPKSFTIYDSDDSQRSMKEVYKQLTVDDKFLPVKSALSAISAYKDKMISYTDARQNAANSRETLIAKVYEAYEKKLKASGAMDFDDLIYNTVELLQKNADVREYYQNKFKYILVDEYQDTSVAQFKLVDLLGSAHRNVCVVGDDDQSIYRFRGATIENILNFESQFSGAKVIRLEQNYRSTSNILGAANCVIKNNLGRKGKTLWTDNGDGAKIVHYEAENEQEEAAYIAKDIQQNLSRGEKLKDHAVLYRMNAQSNTVESYFARAGIPYKIIGGQRFFDRKEVKDILAYMAIVANPQDDLRLKRIINEPSRKIGATTIENAERIAAEEGISLLQTVINARRYPQLSKACGALGNFAEIYEKLCESEKSLPVDEFCAEIINITGYKQMLDAAGEEGKTRLENIGQLVSAVKLYADQNGENASLAGYLEEVALITDLDNYSSDSDVVVMMTMHAAKGLEFNNVYIIGMEEGIFPSEMSRYSDEDLEEERRLCYVGITRAKKKLSLCSAQSRMIFGQTRRNRKSRFLDEIDAEFVEEKQSEYSVRKAQKQQAYAYERPQPTSYFNRSTIAQGMHGAAVKPTGSAHGAAKAAAQSFAPGERIRHLTYGEGTIIKVTPIAGDTLIEIKFDTQPQNKKVMANYAKLIKL